MIVPILPRARIRVLAVSLCAGVIVGCQDPALRSPHISVDELRLTVSQPREISFTNKQAGFYYTVTHGSRTTGWQGWHVFSKKILDDYVLSIDNRPLQTSEVVEAEVFPHLFTRRYQDGTRETVVLLDSVDALLVELFDLDGDTLHAWPLVGDALSRSDFLLRSGPRSLYLARSQHAERKNRSDAPPWIGMRLMSPGSQARMHDVPLDRTGRFAPAGLVLPIHSGRATLFLVAHDSPEQCAALLDRLEPDLHGAVMRRRDRMEAVLRRSFVRTSDTRYNKALYWALLSLDALMMHQARPGIFAGLPWFSNYWGRDTFIALPGATLVTGRFEEAREILRSFADWQETDPRSPSYGRIPNLVTPLSIAYNTADGTPWFVLAVEQYFRVSGDSLFVNTMIPAVKRSIEGTVIHHTDREGLLTHGDAETWMDAVGPAGPWSPRGNRANDIQSLWYRQLLAAAALIDDPSLAQAWRARAERLRSTFIERFVDTTTGLPVDHLNPDGSRDIQLRPNQFFVLATPELVPSPWKSFEAATRKLVYEHGVASLSSQDEDFHPFHHYQPFYVQDAAYHNGIVWTWLAGPWIDAAVSLRHHDLAFTLTKNMTHQILERGAVGTISEVLDAIPREGETEPRLSGTFTQAWSLAEFVRVFYQDYLGVSVDVPHATVTLKPRLPRDLPQASANIRVGSCVLPIDMNASDRTITVSITSPPTAPVLHLRCDFLPSATTRWQFSATLAPGSVSEFTADESSVLQRTGSEGALFEEVIDAQREKLSDLRPPKLAIPTLPAHLKALTGPKHRLLSHDEITASNPAAQVVLERTDSPGDDQGTGFFVYPSTAHLKTGSLDLISVRISSDTANTYVNLGFRNLSNPGWHPEFGFQLTFVAIAIDADRKRSSGERALGWNSNMVFAEDAGYERLILVGGGVRVLDANNAVLGEYVPQPGDERRPLGNTRTGVISFALPSDVLESMFLRGRWTILVGAQDDHGGAGLGEFRSVETMGGEWAGGGRRSATDPNVYDTLIIE